MPKLDKFLSKLKLKGTNFKFRITHPTSAWWGIATGIAALGGFITVVSIWRTWASAAAWFGGCYLIWWLRNRYVSNVLTGCAANLRKAVESTERKEIPDLPKTPGGVRLMLVEWSIDQELAKALKRLKRLRKLHLYPDPYDITGEVEHLLRFSQNLGVRYNVWSNPIVYEDDDIIRPTKISDTDNADEAADRKVWFLRSNQDTIRDKLIPMLQLEAQRVST